MRRETGSGLPASGKACRYRTPYEKVVGLAMGTNGMNVTLHWHPDLYRSLEKPWGLTLPHGICNYQIGRELFKIKTVSIILLLFSLSFAMNARQLYEINVSGARPLNEALFEINNKDAQPIIYEEIAYEFNGDLVSGDKIGLLSSHFYPKGGELRVSLNNESSDGYSAIKTLLAAYKESGLAGDYSVSLNHDAVCILPTTKKDVAGREKSVLPLLNTTISVPRQPRSIPDTASLIASTLSQASGRKVVVLNQPYLHTDDLITWGADKEQAVDALARLEQEIGPVTFRFLFDPSDDTYYFSLSALESVAMDKATQTTPDKELRLTRSPYFLKPH